MLLITKLMTCGCKHKKKGSGGKFLSGVTWRGYGPYKTGKGLNISGSGLKKKRRRKKGKGLNISGSGMGISGSGYIMSGPGFKRTVGYRRK